MTGERIKVIYPALREAEHHLVITIDKHDDWTLDLNLDMSQLIEIVDILDDKINMMQ
jgi:hypothetical protein